MKIFEIIVSNEAAIRVFFFVGIFFIVALLENIVPRRPLDTSKTARWVVNIGIVVINSVVLRLLIPAGAVGISVWVAKQGWGVFNYIEWPFWAEVVLSVILLDCPVDPAMDNRSAFHWQGRPIRHWEKGN
ncbi:hypothetical protein ACFL1Z_01505 [Thermodesulfobacteriota bacterium]